MSGSGSAINYDLRTGKSVERQMLASSVKELFKGVNYNRRRYIGMGSNYFTDFKLFHKQLHIDKMISFESDEQSKKRVEFNKPFKCIDIRMGKSTNLLPTLTWNRSVDFIWMDYDEKLQYDYFTDIETIFSNISKGSVYLMTCNKQLNHYDLTTFSEEFGTLVPHDININNFKGDEDFLLIRRMFINKINDVITNRNYSLSDDKKLIFRQLFFFTYRDGAPMISFGGFLDFKNYSFELKEYNLNKFDFIKQDDERFVINPPIITKKEINLLNSCLPANARFNNLKKINFIPERDRDNYKQLYKFLPIYMDVMY
ncbi:hypothetical protein SAMN05216480_12016 [Pustulibacterium marinum]|uniref:Uncharacterized protein n=1 Tax=Pustulibacterium marinum TaxID=1224947 RepID=A0A1I7IRD0_9FLAO|nr:O-methyltransferase [Pustulibacterium marinum]SFU75492.1 hypothetical protein SAMN05216480_12016 [Pustulibacterium marinum]